MLSFAPDAIDIAPEALSLVSAVPTIRGYRTPPAGVDLQVAQLASASQGAAYLLKLDGTYRTIVGTSSKLWELSGTSWSDVTRGAGYSAGTSRWRYTQIGDTSLACNKAIQLQSSSSGAFADVANAWKAAHIEAVGGFVLVADLDDTGTGLTTGFGSQPHRWACSQSYNPTGTWQPDVATQATSGLLVETPGKVTGLRRLGNECAAYKEKSVYVGRYVPGSADVWRWQCMSKDIGCASADAVVAVGARHFFPGDADFYVFDGSSQPVGIGSLIKDWFFGRLNKTYASSIQSLHDRSSKVIYWFYPADGSTTLNACIAYHYDSERWGAFDIAIYDALETVTGAVTYDTLDDYFATYADLPSTLSYDSPFFSAATPLLAYISDSRYIKSLSGTATTMTMRTGWFGDETRVSTCTRVRPRFRRVPSDATVTPMSCMSLGDTISTWSASTMHEGRFDVLRAARYHRFDLSCTGSCEIEAIVPTLVAQGVE